VPMGVDFHAIDAFDPASVDAAFAAVGSFDVLVMLVGFNHALVPTEERSIDSWDEVIAGNLRAAFLICRAAVPRLRDGGAIVNMASGLATRVMAGYGPYSASKAGVIALTKALAVENAPRLRANAISPAARDASTMKTGSATSRSICKRSRCEDLGKSKMSWARSCSWQAQRRAT
jgi:3-oxoacyl-[acyl-carrier protein] reductase